MADGLGTKSLTDSSELIWSGSYTADADGHGAGINALSVNADGRLMDLEIGVATPSPSFVAIHPSLPVVYAVNEVLGSVSAFRLTHDWKLRPLGESLRAGDAACHIAVDPLGRFVTVACWGDGLVILYELDAEGRTVARFEAERAVDPHPAGSDEPGADPDPHTSMQRQSRAHASLMLDDGRIMTTDLGYDLLRFWTYSPGVGLVGDHTVALPPNSGPRHVVQHPDGRVFVVTEYSIAVVIAERSTDAPNSQFTVRSIVAATAVGAREGDTAAEIALSPSGRYLYVGIRGSDRIATLAIDTERVRAVADVPSGGSGPRHHLVRNGFLHVAHEHSNEVTTFKLDPDTGVPTRVIQRLALGSPTALVLAKPAD
ncbi:beta-propeller fold lactonase family protein [Pseudonocardia sp.]|jgi:6-phosphogluconolactonase (cycloisomerase 2 family)|uniref:lactonase family protein n=1 Tax=Pseudonocardia sp. TaxID=60912 RepID=UPI0031FC0636